MRMAAKPLVRVTVPVISPMRRRRRAPNTVLVVPTTTSAQGVQVQSPITRMLATVALTVAMTGAAVALAGPAAADEIGQPPTAANITGNGSFAVSSSNISSFGT